MYKNWESVLEALEYFFFYSEFYCSSTQDYSPLEICFALQVFDIFLRIKQLYKKINFLDFDIDNLAKN